jgi:hypothetical protein
MPFHHFDGIQHVYGQIDDIIAYAFHYMRGSGVLSHASSRAGGHWRQLPRLLHARSKKIFEPRPEAGELEVSSFSHPQDRSSKQLAVAAWLISLAPGMPPGCAFEDASGEVGRLGGF